VGPDARRRKAVGGSVQLSRLDNRVMAADAIGRSILKVRTLNETHAVDDGQWAEMKNDGSAAASFHDNRTPTIRDRALVRIPILSYLVSQTLPVAPAAGRQFADNNSKIAAILVSPWPR